MTEIERLAKELDEARYALSLVDMDTEPSLYEIRQVKVDALEEAHFRAEFAALGL